MLFYAIILIYQGQKNSGGGLSLRSLCFYSFYLILFLKLCIPTYIKQIIKAITVQKIVQFFCVPFCTVSKERNEKL